MENKIRFTQIYEEWLKGDYHIPSPVCSVTGVKIIPDTISKAKAGFDISFYLRFMNALDKQVCFDVYQNKYAAEFEAMYRRKLLYSSEAVADKIFNKMNLPMSYKHLDFMSLIDVPKQRQLVHTARNFIDSKKTILTLGDKQTGAGKTTMLVCIGLQYWLSYGESQVEYEHEARLIDWYNTAKAKAGLARMHEQLLLPKVLLLDNVFVADNHEYVNMMLFPLIEARLEYQEKITVLAVSKPGKYVQENYPQLYNRLSSGTVYIHGEPFKAWLENWGDYERG